MVELLGMLAAIFAAPFSTLAAHVMRSRKSAPPTAVEQYCPTAGGVVILNVAGEVLGYIVNGRVVGCLKGPCGVEGFCWLEKSILTKGLKE